MIIKRLNNGTYGVVDLLNGHVLYVGTYQECLERAEIRPMSVNSAYAAGSIDRLGYSYCADCKDVTDSDFIVWSDNSAHNHDECELCHGTL